MNFQMFKLVLEKAEEPEIKLPTSTVSLKIANSIIYNNPKLKTIQMITNG